MIAPERASSVKVDDFDHVAREIVTISIIRDGCDLHEAKRESVPWDRVAAKKY